VTSPLEPVIPAPEKLTPSHAETEALLGRTDIADLAAEVAETREADNAERVADRADVLQLMAEVKALRAVVSDLHDLILDSMIKSETAAVLSVKADHRAAATLKKWQVYALTGAVLAVAVILSLLAYDGRQQIKEQIRANRQAQYKNCLARNAQTAGSARSLAAIATAVSRAERKGDLLAVELRGLLIPTNDNVPPPDCEKVRP